VLLALAETLFLGIVCVIGVTGSDVQGSAWPESPGLGSALKAQASGRSQAEP